MKTKVLLTALLLAAVLAQPASAQTPGDYKSNGTGGGAWNNPTTWLTFTDTGYVAATAAPVAGTTIVVQANDSVSISNVETLSKLTIDSSGRVAILQGNAVSLGSNITVNGNLSVKGALTCGTNVISGMGRFQLASGGTLIIGSPSGINATGAAGNIQTAIRVFDQGANYTFSSTAAQVTGTGLPAAITGTVTNDNTNQASGLSLSQNLSVNSTGKFIVPAGRILSCKGTTAVVGSGSFVLSSGATFYIGHAAGLSSNPNTGCVQVTGARTLSADANYIFNGSSAQVTGNSLPNPITGVVIISNTHAEGCTLSSDLAVNLPGFVQVTGAFGCSTFVLSGTGSFTLSNGATLLTGHAAGLSAAGTYGSIQTKTFTFNPAANYIYNGTTPQVTGDGLPATVNSLGINAAATVSLTNNVTVANNLNLTNGTLCLNTKNLTIAAAKTITRQNGLLTLCGGQLVYAGTVNVTYTSTNNLTSDIELLQNTALLTNLTIALTTGKTLTLASNVFVNGSVTMTSGSLNPNSKLTYGPNALLIYNGTAAQTTGAEWPDSAFTTEVSIRNTFATGGVVLDKNRKAYKGTLNVRSGGYFNTGNFAITGTGNIIVNSGGTFMTPHPLGVSPEAAIQLTGARTFASGSSYSFIGTVPQVTGREMPLSVSNITISNTAPNKVVTLTNGGTGTQTVTGTLALTSGVFDLSTNSMNLLFHTGNIPITKTTGFLLLAPTSSLQFGTAGRTAGAAFTLPDNLFTTATPTFRNLTLNRLNPINVGNQNLTLNGTLTLTAGVLNLRNTTLTLQDSDVPVVVGTGALAMNAASSLQFGAVGHTGGAAFTLPNGLFTTAPTFANLTVNRANRLTLGNQNITLTNTLNLQSGGLYIGESTLGLYGYLKMVDGSLHGGAAAGLHIGGINEAFSIPTIEEGLATLIVDRANVNNTPSVTLGADLSIANRLDLAGGSLGLGAHNLTLESDAMIEHADAHHYIVTTNTWQSAGSLLRHVGSEAVLFPVGASTYTPAVLSKSAGQTFQVRVFDGVQSAPNSGAAYPFSADAVNKTWAIEKVAGDNTPATVTLYWNAADENATFDRRKSFVSGFSVGEWDTTSASAAQDLDSGRFSQTRENITAFNLFSIQRDRTVRPAKWISFFASKSGPEVVVKWTVGHGNGLSRFDVERSTNGRTYTTIGSVTAIDTLASKMDYLYIDATPVPYDASFYRLKQVMINGQLEYSENVKIMPDPIVGSIVYPVPVQTDLHIALFTAHSGTVSICMIDASGKLVKKQSAHIKRGNNVLTFGMQELPRGVYIVQVIGDGILYNSHKVVK